VELTPNISEKIAAGAISADKIAAGTITADKIMAETVEAGNLKPAAITQVITGSGQWFDIGFNVQHGSILIMAHATGSGSKGSSQGGSTHMYVQVWRNGMHIADVPLIATTDTVWGDGNGNSGSSTTHYTYTGTLLLSQVTNPGWQGFSFQIHKGDKITNANVSAVIAPALICWASTPPVLIRLPSIRVWP